MSLFMKLYETYDTCSEYVGAMGSGNRMPLLPLYHTVHNAHIEVVLDVEGNFLRGFSRVLDEKNERLTIIPCTEESASRAGSTPAPHPLFDKLQYVAKDYSRYGIEKKYAFSTYREGLAAWCASSYVHSSALVILRYLDKGCLITDLAQDHILHCNPDGTIPLTWGTGRGEKPSIFKASTTGQLDAFVRFRIVGSESEERVWLDPQVWKSWIAYQDSLQQESALCYITGEDKFPVRLSPRNIRRAGDGAKLISSNDTSGFTFRGRFSAANEAFSISREATEKAHSALRWLISRQGYSHDSQAIVAWKVHGGEFPCAIASDSTTCLREIERLENLEATPISTSDEFADRFNKAISSYGSHLSGGEEAAIVGLDSATPGRLSVFYYREMQATDLLDRINSWHHSCIWMHTYGFNNGRVDEKEKRAGTSFSFIGAPSLGDIAEAAYGTGVDVKLKKSTVERLLPCIIDGARFPRDLMVSAFHRASNPVSMGAREISKTTSIACAIIKKYYSDSELKEVISVSLETENTDRSYLFGRALAYARSIEEYAQWITKTDPRSTNAERYQAMFSRHPARTWRLIENQLKPYLSRLHAKKRFQPEAEMRKVLDAIPSDQFNDEALSPLYLLGYSSQMTALSEAAKARKAKQQELGVETEADNY